MFKKRSKIEELISGLTGWSYQAYYILSNNNISFEKAIKGYIYMFIGSFSPIVIETILSHPLGTLITIIGEENI
jgi:hypothetical protein